MDIESKEPANDASCSFKDESVELLLKTSKSEYENEHNRTSIIDSKTNISLPIISAFFLALIQLNDYKAIFRLPTCTFLQWLLPATLFITYTSELILGLLSLFLMKRVILTKEYKTLKIQDLYDEAFLKNKRIYLSIYIIKLYCISTTHNKEQNDMRVKWYRKSWGLMFVTLFLYLVYIILKTNI